MKRRKRLNGVHPESSNINGHGFLLLWYLFLGSLKVFTFSAFIVCRRGRENRWEKGMHRRSHSRTWKPSFNEVPFRIVVVLNVFLFYIYIYILNVPWRFCI